MGQVALADGEQQPTFRPSAAVDFELEMVRILLLILNT